MDLANIAARCTSSWGLKDSPQGSINLTLQAHKRLLIPQMSSHFDNSGTSIKLQEIFFTFFEVSFLFFFFYFSFLFIL